MKRSFYKAFTLIEVIVVLTIIWLLSIVSYITYSSYSRSAKDTVLMQDITIISDVIWAEIINNKIDLYAPDGAITEVERENRKWEQWNFWERNYTKFTNLLTLPVSPFDWNKYTYLVSKDKKFFIIEWTLSNGEVYSKSNLDTSILAKEEEKKEPEKKKDCWTWRIYYWNTCVSPGNITFYYSWIKDWDTIEIPFKWKTNVVEINWWDDWINNYPTTTKWSVSCTYKNASKGNYSIQVKWIMTWLWKKWTSSIDKLKSATFYNNISMEDFSYAFYWAVNLSAVSFLPWVWNTETSRVKNMEYMFSWVNNFYSWNRLTTWDVSRVENMRGMFENSNFNSPIWQWDVSNVRDMSYMFSNARNFNQDINQWWSKTKKVTNMSYMFRWATNFDKSLNDWDVSNVKYMSYMFAWASNFNWDISKWDVSNVQYTNEMFASTDKFNWDISKWNVSKVESMKWMFAWTRVFNRDISNWNISKVVSMESMFSWAKVFDQPIWKWDVSRVATINHMFDSANGFNQDLSSWKVNGSCFKSFVNHFEKPGRIFPLNKRPRNPECQQRCFDGQC